MNFTVSIIVIYLLSILSIPPRPIIFIYVEPDGETFTEFEKAQALANLNDSLRFWTELAPTPPNLVLNDTLFITATADIFTKPETLIQRIPSTTALIIFVIDNSRSGGKLYDRAWGLALPDIIWVVSLAQAETYAHEFGHSIYGLQHTTVWPDIMNLNPFPAYILHTIGCGSLAALGKPCTNVYLSIIKT